MAMSKKDVIKTLSVLAGIGIFGIVAKFFLFYTVELRSSEAELERRYAEIRAKGEPVSADDFQYNQVDPEKNAETYIRLANAEIKKTYEELEILKERFHEEHGWDKDFDPGISESTFATNARIIQLLEKATECPEYSSDFSKSVTNSDDLYGIKVSFLDDHRSITRILCLYRVQHFLSEGKCDEAVRSCLTMLRLIRKFENDPLFLNYTMIACDSRDLAFMGLNAALQSGHVSDGVRQELTEELVKHNIRKTLLQTLKNQRPFDLSAFDYFQSEGSWFSRAYINRQKLDYLEEIDSKIANARAALTNGDMPVLIPTSSGATSYSLKHPDTADEYVLLLNWLYRDAEKTTKKTEAIQRSLRVLVALGMRDDPDILPLPDLSDLGLSKETTIDPYNGRPLIVKKVDGGWLIYSVGENLLDDGGMLEDELDIGLRPVIPAEPDIDPKTQ